MVGDTQLLTGGGGHPVSGWHSESIGWGYPISGLGWVSHWVGATRLRGLGARHPMIGCGG